MPRGVGGLALAVVAVVLATWVIGWWMVPVVAGVWAVADREDRWIPVKAGAGSALAWGVLLLVQAPGGGVSRIAESVGAVIGIGGFAFVILTLLFPALLAASAAVLVRAALPGSKEAGGRVA